MKTEKILAPKGGEAKETRADKAIRLLETTITDPFNQKLDEFKAFYPAVVTAKRNGMKNKQVIKILGEAGMKLYPALLEKLMSAIAREPEADMCALCGHAVTIQAGQFDARTSVVTNLDESRACTAEGA
jgi:hypothetical protein